MNNKYVAKKYIIYVSALFMALLVVTAIILFSLYFAGINKLDLNASQLALISVASAYVPSASFTGFYLFFMPIIKKNNPSKALKILIAIFYPVFIVVVTIIGVFMLIPAYFINLVIAIKEKHNSK